MAIEVFKPGDGQNGSPATGKPKTGFLGRLFGRAAEVSLPGPLASPRAQSLEPVAPEPVVPEPAAVAAVPPAPAPPPKLSWWQRLRSGMSRSSASIGQGIVDVFTKRKLDAAMLEDLEDILIKADLG